MNLPPLAQPPIFHCSLFIVSTITAKQILEYHGAIKFRKNPCKKLITEAIASVFSKREMIYFYRLQSKGESDRLTSDVKIT